MIIAPKLVHKYVHYYIRNIFGYGGTQHAISYWYSTMAACFMLPFLKTFSEWNQSNHMSCVQEKFPRLQLLHYIFCNTEPLTIIILPGVQRLVKLLWTTNPGVIKEATTLELEVCILTFVRSLRESNFAMYTRYLIRNCSLLQIRSYNISASERYG